MPTLKKKTNFLCSEEAVEIKRLLRLMATDIAYNTKSSYSTNSELYPDNLIPFVDKHMNFLSTHPSTDPAQYMANLRLMTLVR